MFESSFESKCREVIERLFETVEEKRGRSEVKATLRHIIDIGDSSPGPLQLAKLEYYLLPSTLHNITNLYCYIRYLQATVHPAPPRHILIMLMLQSYLQCMETSNFYKVVGNLFKLMSGEPCEGEIYDSFISGHQCYIDLKNLSRKVGGVASDLLALWDSFADYELRNAVAHNDYIIYADRGYVIIPYYALGNSIKGHQKAGKKDLYSLEEIEDRFVKANEFHSGFMIVLQRYGIALGPRY